MVSRKRRLAALLLAAMVTGPAIAGNAGQCYTIGDADSRNYCRAKALGNPAICDTIRSADKRALCKAEIG
jgi:hypothetical protein